MLEVTLNRIIAQVNGATGAAVLSLHGLPITVIDRSGGPVESDRALEEYASITKQLTGAAQAMEVGELDELTITSGDRILLVRAITSQYFVALITEPTAPAGKSRFYLRCAAPDLAREF